MQLRLAVRVISSLAARTRSKDLPSLSVHWTISLAMAALDAVLQLVLLSVQAERTLAGEVPDSFVLPQPGERVVHAVHVGDERHLRHLALDHILQSNNSQLTTLNTMTLLKRESRICGVQGIV